MIVDGYEILGDDLQFVKIEMDPNEAVIGEAGAKIVFDIDYRPNLWGLAGHDALQDCHPALSARCWREGAGPRFCSISACPAKPKGRPREFPSHDEGQKKPRQRATEFSPPQRVRAADGGIKPRVSEANPGT